MTSLDTLADIIAAKIGNTEAATRKGIKSAILMAWDFVAEYRSWPFLESPDSYKLAITAGDTIYTLKKIEIGRVLYITDSDGMPQWSFKTREQFVRLLRERAEIETDDPLYVTIKGVREGNTVIELYPIPSADETTYVHFTEKGAEGNLEKMPFGWSKVIVHLAMSMIGPPSEFQHAQGQLRWKALTKDEHALAMATLAEMIGHFKPLGDPEPEFRLDTHVADGMEEINDAADL